MNLADIRKKAQHAQSQKVVDSDIPDAAPVTEFPDILGETEEQPAEPMFLQDERPSAGQTRRADIETQWQSFDPIRVLLAGRELSEQETDGIVMADKALQQEAAGYLEFLCFRVASEKYAITIMEIKEIIKPREVTEVPRVPGFVTGVLSLRGVIIPVFSLVKRLCLPECDRLTGKERIIVVKKGDDFCGVLVDEVIQVVRIASVSIEPPPAVLDGIDREFVSGIGRNDSQMLILLNMEKILDVSLC